MAKLSALRRRVLVRLNDMERKRAFEADEFLNEAQDVFLRRTEFHRITDEIDVTADTAKYTITIPTGLVMVEVKSVTYKNALESRPLCLTTAAEMDATRTLWQSLKGCPEWYIRNLNLATEGAPSPHSMTLSPIPDADATKGLRVVFSATTSYALTTDDSETLYPEYDDALVSYALVQMGHAAAERFGLEFEGRVLEAKSLANRGYERQTIRVQSARDPRR